jgi:N-acetylglutamate synthase-like GNAT family acetyltransferase
MIRRATDADLPLVIKLLNEASLPAAGLAEQRGHLYALVSRETVVGAVGYEVHSPDVLLRSLVVAPAARGQGRGLQLISFILEQCRLDGIRNAYALTTTIPHLLSRLGFEEVKRSAAPAALRSSDEFQGSCPSRARLFRIPVTAGLTPPPKAARKSRKKEVRT